MSNGSGEWTVETLRIHTTELHAAEEKFQAERDRRYAEVNTEREKALKIKEEADRRALELASEIQKYKDEKANELRSQIGSERGLYPTKAEMFTQISTIRGEIIAAIEKIDLTIKPLVAYNNAQNGPRALTGGTLYTVVFGAISLVGALATLIVFVVKRA